jgi:hypothetical protein
MPDLIEFHRSRIEKMLNGLPFALFFRVENEYDYILAIYNKTRTFCVDASLSEEDFGKPDEEFIERIIVPRLAMLKHAEEDNARRS